MSGTLFGDVMDWFLSRGGDRGRYKRRAGAFHVWYEPGEGAAAVQGIGTEISPSGLVFIVNAQIPKAEANLSVVLRNKRFAVRVKLVRSDTVDYKGQPWMRYAAEFTGIAADSWDLIVRYVNDEPEIDDRRHSEHQEAAAKPDDAYRLLPMAVQNRIVELLVQRKRLEPPKAGQTPLLKLFYGGSHKPDGKAPVHRVNVHSRVIVNDEPVDYDTRFLVEDNGKVTLA